MHWQSRLTPMNSRWLFLLCSHLWNRLLTSNHRAQWAAGKEEPRSDVSSVTFQQLCSVSHIKIWCVHVLASSELDCHQWHQSQFHASEKVCLLNWSWGLKETRFTVLPENLTGFLKVFYKRIGAQPRLQKDGAITTLLQLDERKDYYL